MAIIDKIQQENLEYIYLENFMDILDFSLSGTGYGGFYLLPILLDKGLRVSYTESGYLFDEKMVFKGDIKCALIRLEDKLFDTDEPKSKLYKDAIIKTQDGFETSLGRLLVKRSDVENAYTDYGETKFPWALIPRPETNNEWDWFSVNQNDTCIRVSKAKNTKAGDGQGIEAIQHDESICKQPFFDWENDKHFPDFLTISQIVNIKYPDPETQAEKDDYVRRTALMAKRDKLETRLLDVCRAGALEYEGNFALEIDEIYPYIVPTPGKFYITPPVPPKENQLFKKLVPSTLKIHKTKFKKFVEGSEKWFSVDFWRELANWYDERNAGAMLESNSEKNMQELTLTPRSGGYAARDNFVIKLIENRPELLGMRPFEIKAILKATSNLFTSGYPDWWRNNTIFKKGKPGQPKKK
jgi:hypothetical protein